MGNSQRLHPRAPCPAFRNDSPFQELFGAYIAQGKWLGSFLFPKLPSVLEASLLPLGGNLSILSQIDKIGYKNECLIHRVSVAQASLLFQAQAILQLPPPEQMY